MKLYYYEGSERKGPVVSLVLRDLAKKGVVTPETILETAFGSRIPAKDVATLTPGFSLAREFEGASKGADRNALKGAGAGSGAGASVGQTNNLGVERARFSASRSDNKSAKDSGKTANATRPKPQTIPAASSTATERAKIQPPTQAPKPTQTQAPTQAPRPTTFDAPTIDMGCSIGLDAAFASPSASTYSASVPTPKPLGGDVPKIETASQAARELANRSNAELEAKLKEIEEQNRRKAQRAQTECAASRSQSVERPEQSQARGIRSGFQPLPNQPAPLEDALDPFEAQLLDELQTPDATQTRSSRISPAQKKRQEEADRFSTTLDPTAIYEAERKRQMETRNQAANAPKEKDKSGCFIPIVLLFVVFPIMSAKLGNAVGCFCVLGIGYALYWGRKKILDWLNDDQRDK